MSLWEQALQLYILSCILNIDWHLSVFWKKQMNAIYEKLKEEYLYAWDKEETENCLAIYDSESSFVPKKLMLIFGALLLKKETHLGFQQAVDYQCVCSVIYSCSFWMSLELHNHALRMQIEYLYVLFHLPPL